ncbi:MAG: hypothetical protein ACTJLM_02860 [Ehrlichia sp.]
MSSNNKWVTMKLKEANISGMSILCLTLIVVLYGRMKMLYTKSILLDEVEESSYLRSIMISCLNIVLCCIIYIMMLIHSNIKLMLFLLSKITSENSNELHDVVFRLLSTRAVHFIVLHVHLKFLGNISKNKLANKSKMYENLANKTDMIIKSIEHHRKLYENFVLPI